MCEGMCECVFVSLLVCVLCMQIYALVQEGCIAVFESESAGENKMIYMSCSVIGKYWLHLDLNSINLHLIIIKVRI